MEKINTGFCCSLCVYLSTLQHVPFVHDLQRVHLLCVSHPGQSHLRIDKSVHIHNHLLHNRTNTNPLTSLKVPRPITFKMSKSSLLIRVFFTCLTRGSAGIGERKDNINRLRSA